MSAAIRKLPLHLDHLHDLRVFWIGLGVEDVDARGAQARHDEVPSFGMGMRCIWAQAGTARVPAEMVQFVAALRHVPSDPAFNPHLRELLHVGYKVAAKLGRRYLDALESCEASVAKNVTENLYDRHLKPLFVDHH